MFMRSYAYISIIVILAFLLSLNTTKFFDFQETSLFLTVIGLIYGLISAFTINNAWERFSKIRDQIANETNSLIAAYLYSKHVSDKLTFNKLKTKIIEYCKEIPKIEWHNYWHSKKTHKKFRDIIEIISDMKLKNIKDIELFDEISEELRSASQARTSQLVLSRTRVSKMQWILNIFLSLILIIGLVFLQLPNYPLSIFIISTMIISILMILYVIYQMDSLKIGEEEVSTEPYNEVVNIIKYD